jgi:hypothetical protein
MGTNNRDRKTYGCTGMAFSLSSYGAQVPDTSGDEPDRLDEAFCPHDLAAKGNQWDPKYIIFHYRFRKPNEVDVRSNKVWKN